MKSSGEDTRSRPSISRPLSSIIRLSIGQLLLRYLLLLHQSRLVPGEYSAEYAVNDSLFSSEMDIELVNNQSLPRKYMFGYIVDEDDVDKPGHSRGNQSMTDDVLRNVPAEDLKKYAPKGVINFGFITSFREPNGVGKLISGAIPLAVEKVNKDPDMLPDRMIRFLAGMAGAPGSPSAIRLMTKMKDEGAVAFIGPDHSCANEAMVAAAWRVPMITYKCSDRRVSDKSIYSTFARTLPPSSKISKSVISLLLHFGWTKVTLIVSANPADKQVEESLKILAQNHSINITQTVYLPANYVSRYNGTIKNIVETTSERSRVYIMLADTLALTDFVRLMANKDLLKSGDYVIISVEEEEFYIPNRDFQYIRPITEAAKNNNEFDPLPFRSVLMLTPSRPSNPEYEQFQNAVYTYCTLPPFKVPFHPILRIAVPIYAALAYDAVLIYARALTEVLKKNGSEHDGEAIFNQIKSRSYESILGFNVQMDENGDAEGNYTLLALVDQKSMMPVGKFTHSDENLPVLHLNHKIDWVTGHHPKSEPECGFDGEHCEREPVDWRMIVICSICAYVLVVVVFFAFRHYRYEHKLACLLWKVDLKDVVLLCTDSEYCLQNFKNAISCGSETQSLQAPETTPESERTSVDGFRFLQDRHIAKSGSGLQARWRLEVRTPSTVGFYKGNVVFIKHVFKKNIDLTRSLRKEMIEIREMRHENINPFIGACVDHPNICIITVFCARGSLEDVLKNEDLDLDNMFVASLVADLIKGMIYLHDSVIISHGNLKSSNCLVDSRWVLQITDFGLHEFKGGQEPAPAEIERRRLRGLLWRAPELLRLLHPPPRGTQKGDVYSFGIILFEIIARQGPWGNSAPPVKCILERVISPHLNRNKYYRPPVKETLNNCAEYIKTCMEECWDEDQDQRPDFRFINTRLRDMQAGLKPNIFDNMMTIMEKYASNLEGLVQERTNQLMEEKKKTENLLLRMLPKPVAEQLKKGQQVEAESFDCVTIYFSDIVGFTTLSAESTPFQVVELLNDLYTCFDSIVGHYDVYKVETIGDAYMVVSGLPLRNGDKHAGEIASMALILLGAIRTFKIKHRTGETLKLRIGIHSGSCVAGVVGLKMPRYCLFGDTVNTASRMESSGEALKIHVSEQCKHILDKLQGGYKLVERGMTHVKGKGEMRTYWLVGKQDVAAEQRSGTLSLDRKVPGSNHTRNESAPLATTSETHSVEIYQPNQPPKAFNSKFHNSFRRASGIGQTLSLGRVSKYSQGGEVDVGDVNCLLDDDGEQEPEITSNTDRVSLLRDHDALYQERTLGREGSLDNCKKEPNNNGILPPFCQPLTLKNTNLVSSSENALNNAGSCINLFHDYRRGLREFNPRRGRCGPGVLHGVPFRYAGDFKVASLDGSSSVPLGYRSAPIISLRDRSPKDVS